MGSRRRKHDVLCVSVRGGSGVAEVAGSFDRLGAELSISGGSWRGGSIVVPNPGERAAGWVPDVRRSGRTGRRAG